MNDNDFNTQFYDFDEFEDFDAFNEEPTTLYSSAQTTNEIGSAFNGTRATHMEEDVEDDSEEEAAEEDTESACNEPLWSIDDDTLFHAFGLINHSTGVGKSVFVTWNENYLQNFIFKKSKTSKNVNMTKVRLTLPPNEEIKEILILDYNTLILMHSGRVFYLSSVKSMHVVSWLDGVRCISTADEGFSVIRLLTDNTLSLEVYRDVVSIGKADAESTRVCSYDITFDPVNLFNCQWNDEAYTLLSIKVSQENWKFLQKIVEKLSEKHVDKELHIFTVSGNVFALIPEPSVSSEDYSIELLNVYAMPVAFIKIDCVRQIGLVFFECGSIDIWYISSLMKTMLTVSHHTSSKFVDYAYNPKNGNFYFTDMEKVAQLQFKFDSYKDVYLVEEKYKPLPDILACTWVNKVQQLICLSSNNIFYQLGFETTTELPELEPAPEFESLSEVYELSAKKMCMLLKNAKAIEDLTKLPGEVHEAIEQEYQKQQILAVAKKQNIYKKLLKGWLEYHRYLPMHDEGNTLLLFTQESHQMQSNSLFALIYLQLTRNEVFQSSMWLLYLSYKQNCYTFHISEKHIYKRLCVVVPLHFIPLEILPHFQVQLVTFISNSNHEHLVISLSSKLSVTKDSYVNIFGLQETSLSVHHKNGIHQLIAHFMKTPWNEEKPQKLKATINLPNGITFETIMKAFNVNSEVIELIDDLLVYVMSTPMKLLRLQETNSLRLECHCPIAIFYTKLYLYHYMKGNPKQVKSNDEEPSGSGKAQLFMKLQCDVERCYGQLMPFESDNIVGSSPSLHLDDLKRIYTKMRELPLRIFS